MFVSDKDSLCRIYRPTIKTNNKVAYFSGLGQFVAITRVQSHILELLSVLIVDGENEDVINEDFVDVFVVLSSLLNLNVATNRKIAND